MNFNDSFIFFCTFYLFSAVSWQTLGWVTLVWPLEQTDEAKVCGCGSLSLCFSSFENCHKLWEQQVLVGPVRDTLDLVHTHSEMIYYPRGRRIWGSSELKGTSMWWDRWGTRSFQSKFWGPTTCWLFLFFSIKKYSREVKSVNCSRCLAS